MKKGFKAFNKDLQCRDFQYEVGQNYTLEGKIAICERGFHDSPMSLIAKDADVSVGIIYHYFDNKEDLIASLYVNLKSDFLRKIVDGIAGLVSLEPETVVVVGAGDELDVVVRTRHTVGIPIDGDRPMRGHVWIVSPYVRRGQGWRHRQTGQPKQHQESYDSKTT